MFLISRSLLSSKDLFVGNDDEGDVPDEHLDREDEGVKEEEEGTFFGTILMVERFDDDRVSDSVKVGILGSRIFRDNIRFRSRLGPKRYH